MSVMLSMALFAGCIEGVNDNSSEFNGIEYKDPPEAPGFTLTDQHGRNVSLSDYEDKIVVLAFIYTSCPDVCLIISSNLQWTKMRLDEQGMSDEVVFLSVTIDPAKDTVDRLSRWTDATGYDWPHLTSTDIDSLVSVWEDWNVVVDNDHINASTPPDDSTNRVLVVSPDGLEMKIDTPWQDVEFSQTTDGLLEFAFESRNLTYDSLNGTILDWTANDTFSWDMLIWNQSTENWTKTDTPPQDILLSPDTHIAFAPSDYNTTDLPPGVDCNGHGWVMGTGSGAHCMCDEGYVRPDGNWLGCISESAEDGVTGVDPHEQSLGDYRVGHTTATFIVDRNGDKRIAWGGVTWDPSLFLMDIELLLEE